MQNRSDQKLQEARRLLEVHNDNVMILQNDLQKLTQEQSQLMTEAQQNIRSLEPMLNQAKADLQRAQNEFAAKERTHADKVAQVMKKSEADLKMLQNKTERKNQEIRMERAALTRAEADIRNLEKQVEAEQKMALRNAANDNHRSPERRRL